MTGTDDRAASDRRANLTPPFVESRKGDRIDWIAQRYYGYTSGAVEAILTANPGLADQPVRLPLGLRIALPQLPSPKSSRVRLWA